MTLKYRREGDKAFAIVRKYKGRGDDSPYRIVPVIINKVGTKYIYLKYDRELMAAKAQQGKFCKKTGRDHASSPYIWRYLFDTEEEARKWIHAKAVYWWADKVRYIAQNSSLEDLQAAGKALGIKDPGDFIEATSNTKETL